MFPTNLGNGFWIVHNSEQVLDAAFNQYCTKSPLKSSRDLDYLRKEFQRYQILAYRTPQVFPQIVHISFRDNMRIVLEGTALPNDYLIACGNSGVRPSVHDVKMKLDLMANAVIYDVNNEIESKKFTTWAFMHITHRKVAMRSLEALGYSPNDVCVMSNSELERQMFIEGHGGVVIGTPCYTKEQTMLEHIAVTLNPEIMLHRDNFPLFLDKLMREVSNVQSQSKEFIVEKNNGYEYRISVQHNAQAVSWQSKPVTITERLRFTRYEDAYLTRATNDSTRSMVSESELQK